MHERRKYYDITEANAVVPALELIFSEMAKIQRKVNTLSDYAGKMGVTLKLDEAIRGNPSTHPLRRQIEDRIVALSEEYEERLVELDRLGVIIDDMDFGMVKFYSWVGGNEIFLSWQYGETAVNYWHSVSENGVARRPLGEGARERASEIVFH